MIAERLRKAVLQAAMEGKLTKQLDNDSSVYQLIKEVHKIDNDYLWEIPKKWAWVKFGDLVDFKMGKTPERANLIYWGNDVPWISIADMNNQSFIMETKEKVSNSALESIFKEQISPKGTLIMSFKLTVGRTSILGIDALHNEAIISIFPKKEPDTQKKYLYFVLPEIANMGETKDAIKGKTLNSKSIYNLLIPLPPIEEQKRIVEKLEVLLAEINKLEKDEKALKKLEDKFPERLKSAILQAAIQGRISNQSIDKDNSYNHSGINGNKPITYEENDKTGQVVPTTWRFYKLVDVSDVIGGYAFKSSEYLKSNIENGVRVIRISDFNNDGLIDNSPVYYDEDNKLSRYEIRENDILLCMTGGTVGKNTLVNNIDKKLYLNQRVAAIRNNSPSLLNTEYLHIVLNTPYIQKIINDSKNSTNDNISMRQINNFIIPIPPLKEQIEIINKIKKLSINIETM
ncbi:MAG: restriction endonuclease subunit S [Bacilli bacterium]|nr:restriction endonuclease subunit S [Bacilli bacterium]MDD3121815.1 restriction endonuclease subunit S [Bacilli bacterium]MDD4063811.1 restriction endonuclease subunit S [Bacilli bacterium]